MNSTAEDRRELALMARFGRVSRLSIGRPTGMAILRNGWFNRSGLLGPAMLAVQRMVQSKQEHPASTSPVPVQPVELGGSRWRALLRSASRVTVNGQTAEVNSVGRFGGRRTCRSRGGFTSQPSLAAGRLPRVGECKSKATRSSPKGLHSVAAHADRSHCRPSTPAAPLR